MPKMEASPPAKRARRNLPPGTLSTKASTSEPKEVLNSQGDKNTLSSRLASATAPKDGSEAALTNDQNDTVLAPSFSSTGPATATPQVKTQGATERATRAGTRATTEVKTEAGTTPARQDVSVEVAAENPGQLSDPPAPQPSGPNQKVTASSGSTSFAKASYALPLPPPPQPAAHSAHSLSETVEQLKVHKIHQNDSTARSSLPPLGRPQLASASASGPWPALTPNPVSVPDHRGDMGKILKPPTPQHGNNLGHNSKLPSTANSSNSIRTSGHIVSSTLAIKSSGDCRDGEVLMRSGDTVRSTAKTQGQARRKRRADEVIDLTATEIPKAVTVNGPAPRRSASRHGGVSLEDLLNSAETLDPGQWLDDRVVLSFIRRYAKGTVGYLDSLVLDVSEGGKNAKKQYVSAMRGKEIILLAVCNREAKHWTLYAFYPQEKRLEHYDSARNALYAKDEGWVSERERVRSLFAKISSDSSISQWDMTTVKCIQQQNNDDCGVFTLLNAAHVAANIPVPDFEDGIEAGKSLRAEFKDALFTSNTPLTPNSQPARLISARLEGDCAKHEIFRLYFKELSAASLGQLKPTQFLPSVGLGEIRRQEKHPLHFAAAGLSLAMNAGAMRRLHNRHSLALRTAIALEANFETCQGFKHQLATALRGFNSWKKASLGIRRRQATVPGGYFANAPAMKQMVQAFQQAEGMLGSSIRRYPDTKEARMEVSMAWSMCVALLVIIRKSSEKQERARLDYFHLSEPAGEAGPRMDKDSQKSDGLSDGFWGMLR